MAITKISDLKGNKAPLQTVDMPIPELATGELLIKVNTCGVCHTELDEIEGRLELTELPIIPGHQVVGSIVETGGEEDQVEAGGETRTRDYLLGSCNKVYSVLRACKPKELFFRHRFFCRPLIRLMRAQYNR